jgi:predicted esterase
LKIDIAQTWVGNEGYGSSATQATAGNRPAFIPAYFNGRDSLAFTMAAKALTLANYTQSDNIFATGGTYTCVVAPVSDGASQLGRIIEKVNGGGSACWNLITGALSGGYVKIQFNRVTSGTAGAWTTNNVVQVNVPQIISISYNDADPTTAPVIRVQGVPVTVTTTTPPTGTPLSDAGGAYTIGNRAAGDRGFEGYHMIHRMWKRVLSNFEHGRQERYLAAEWGATLYNSTIDTTGRSLSYGGRNFFITGPTDQSGTKPIVYFFHGGGGTAATFITQTAGVAALMAESCYMVFLTATPNYADVTSWNPDDSVYFNRAPDSQYLIDLDTHIRTKLLPTKIDATKRRAMAHSVGSMFVYRMAIEYPTFFDRIFCLSGEAMITNTNLYTGRIRHYHGADDANVPLAGGVGPSGAAYTPVQANIQAFTASNSGAGVVVDTDFIVLPSPAEHTVSSIGTALALPPYSTTLPAVINSFILGA